MLEARSQGLPLHQERPESLVAIKTVLRGEEVNLGVESWHTKQKKAFIHLMPFLQSVRI